MYCTGKKFAQFFKTEFSWFLPSTLPYYGKNANRNPRNFHKILSKIKLPEFWRSCHRHFSVKFILRCNWTFKVRCKFSPSKVCLQITFSTERTRSELRIGQALNSDQLRRNTSFRLDFNFDVQKLCLPIFLKQNSIQITFVFENCKASQNTTFTKTTRQIPVHDQTKYCCYLLQASLLIS